MGTMESPNCHDGGLDDAPPPAVPDVQVHRRHKRAGSARVLSVETTADGDIRTVEEGDDDENDGADYDSVRAFTHHLRDSWEGDDSAIVDRGATTAASASASARGAGGGTRSSSPPRHHRPSLSVQFLDFTISGDDVAGEDAANSNAANDDGGVGRRSNDDGRGGALFVAKGTIEHAAAYYFDPPVPVPSPPSASSGTNASPSREIGGEDFDVDNDDDATTNADAVAFANNIRNSWDLGEECCDADGIGRDDDPSSSSHRRRPSSTTTRGHKSTLSVQFLDEAIFDLPPLSPAPAAAEDDENDYGNDDGGAHDIVVAGATSGTASAVESSFPGGGGGRRRRMPSTRDDSPCANRVRHGTSDSPLPPSPAIESSSSGVGVRMGVGAGGIMQRHRRPSPQTSSSRDDSPGGSNRARLGSDSPISPYPAIETTLPGAAGGGGEMQRHRRPSPRTSSSSREDSPGANRARLGSDPSLARGEQRRRTSRTPSPFDSPSVHRARRGGSDSPHGRGRLGSDSPISPYSSSSERNDDVVSPINFRIPPGGTAGGQDGGGGTIGGRKHRRVFSGRSDPAMVHRRVNTRGDKCEAGDEFAMRDGLNDGGGGKDVRTDAMLRPSIDQTPAVENRPPPFPLQQQTQQPQMQGHSYSHSVYLRPPPIPVQQQTQQPHEQGQQPPHCHNLYHSYYQGTPPQSMTEDMPQQPSQHQVTQAHPSPYSHQYPAYCQDQQPPPHHCHQYPAYYHGTPPMPIHQPPQQHHAQVHPPHDHQYRDHHHGCPSLHTNCNGDQFPPQAPYNQNTPPPPPVVYYETSPRSDAHYNKSHHSSPVVSGYHSQENPSQQSFNQSHQSSPVVSGYHSQDNPSQRSSPYDRRPYPSPPPPAPVQYYAEEGASRANMHPPPPPPQLAQPELDENNPIFPHSQKADVYNIKLPERVRAHGHKKLASLDLVPPGENERTSLGNFLATTSLFDEDTFSVNDGGASQEIYRDKHSHRQTLSNISFNFSQTSLEEVKELAASSEITQQPTSHPASNTSSDYPTLSSTPGDPNVTVQQLPPRAAPGYPSATLMYSTDGYRIQCPSPTVANAVAPPGTYPPTPPAYTSSSPYPLQSTSPVISYPMVPPPPPMPGTTPGYPPPPSPVYSSGGYQMQSTNPIVSNAIAQRPPVPLHPPTPPGYYNYDTPPQAMWHPQHHQQSPNPHSMHQPPPQHMHYSHTPYNNSQPYPQPCHPGSASPQSGGFNHVIHQQSMCPPAPSPNELYSPDESEEGKRSRRKCSVPDCPNRVVQGGKCIRHGAERKTCAHPGCAKNVKKAGMCSTHGPRRKGCEFNGCSKVAVQGGRCISHGAKKKVCCFDECNKQAILNGMCKKHHDESNGIVRNPTFDGTSTDVVCPVVGDNLEKKDTGHRRGLSIFQDNDLMNTIINNGAPGIPPTPAENDGLHGLSIF